MTVRRGGATAAPGGGSPSDGLDPATRERVLAVVAAHRGDRGPLLPILHGIAAELGHVDEAVVPLLADELNLSRADVHGVISFYHDFRRSPAGRTVVRLCRAEACQAMGSAALVDEVTGRYGVPLGGTSADGAVTVEQVFCFGNCALAPAAEVAGELIGRADAGRVAAAVDRHAALAEQAQQAGQARQGEEQS